MSQIGLTVNGERRELSCPDHAVLVDVLREQLRLTGTHVGCANGDCGACTVLLDGGTVKSCLILAGALDGATVTTIEGISPDGELSPVQEAFWAEHGFQCGFCLPGMLLCAEELRAATDTPTREQMLAAINGNLCRCTGYRNVLRAIEAASRDPTEKEAT